MKDSEVMITQYFSHNGRQVYIDIGVEKATIANKHKFIFSVEALGRNGEVALFGRLPEQTVRDEIVELISWSDNPVTKLCKIIDQLEEKRRKTCNDNSNNLYSR